jgi:hypothetical protein
LICAFYRLLWSLLNQNVFYRFVWMNWSNNWLLFVRVFLNLLVSGYYLLFNFFRNLNFFHWLNKIDFYFCWSFFSQSADLIMNRRAKLISKISLEVDFSLVENYENDLKVFYHLLQSMYWRILFLQMTK